MRRYYAAVNSYGSNTSHGFANTWGTLVFESREARDKFVNDSDNITAIAIRRTQATRYATNWSLSRNKDIFPRPFTGEFWGIEPWWGNEINGCIGSIAICSREDRGVVESFYNN